MADDLQVTRAGRPALEATPGPSRPEIVTDDPDAARARIEATRARMSETIDEIEDVLLAKKEKIREQLDVLAPVRENPVKTLAMIFGAALVLGLLTGGGKGRSGEAPRLRSRSDDDDDDDDGEYEEDDEDEQDDEAAWAWQRAEEWEDRAHRLLRIAKAQEEELEIHRSRREALRRRMQSLRRYDDDDDEDDDDEEPSEPNFFERIRESAAERVADLAGEISHRMMRGG